MARADLLYNLIKHGLSGDNPNFRRTVEAICAEERGKQHNILAERFEELLKQPIKREINQISRANGIEQTLFAESIPKCDIEYLVLPETVKKQCNELIEEQNRADLLRSYGLEPRNKLLLIGPPGNGKTSLAGAIANALMLPLLTVRYESIVGAYLGETANRLSKLMDYVRTRQCVLFFDEFETLGKERGDIHETGEIKRVVSSLLLQLDSLPSYVIVIGATNHESLLDNAAWRRFQIKCELPRPSRAQLAFWFTQFEKRTKISFGMEPSTLAKKLLGKSFAEAEDFALSVYRQYILRLPNADIKSITYEELKLFGAQAQGKVVYETEVNSDARATINSVSDT